MNTKNEPTSKAQDRAEMQRNRILDAAQHCFIEHGFHAASMASIADTAGMSAGLIYRYFENKSAIILAIVDRQLHLLRDDIRLNRRIDLPAEMAQNYGRSCASEGKGMNAALLLEISAEATRDPQVAAALDHFDVTPGRALLLQCLFEGLKLRETREPELDRELLSAALHEFVPLLLKP